MRKILILSVFSFLLLFTTSCDKDFEEINSDPNNPTSIESGLLMADALRLTTNQTYSTFVGGDMGSCWSQQWAKVQYNDEARYIPRTSVIQIFWDAIYEDLASDANTIYDLAVEEGNSNMQGVGLVMKAYAFSLLADVFGDVPFSEALTADEGNLAPAYDSQQAVYAGVLALLDEANGLLSAGGGDINSSSDLLYGGDYLGWQKFANSLKFRILMRISGTSDHNAAALQEIASSRAIFTSVGDNAQVTYLSSDPNANPIYETIDFGSRNEFKVSDVLVNMLTANSDPRLEVYAQLNDGDIYRGKPAGIFDVPNVDYDYNNVSAVGLKYLEPELPGVFMSYSELMFLMAEAATNGYITGSAQTYYDNGIAASMTENGISDYSMINTVLGTGEAARQNIGEQKWLALYCQGVEAWTEWRRTGYPVLTPAIEGAISVIPQRYTYPTTEQSLNAANYSAAVANQGADALETTLWSNK